MNCFHFRSRRTSPKKIKEVNIEKIAPIPPVIPSSFPLLSVQPELFEKIINKSNGNDYFRLRQTCHALNDLVQNNPRISVHVEENFTIREEDGKPCRLFHLMRDDDFNEEGYYGTRIREIWTSPESEKEFGPLVEYLKKSRITCVKLILTEQVWSKEQCAILIKIMKPTHIRLASGIHFNKPDRHEALLGNKTVKDADICVNPELGAIVVEKLLHQFEVAKVHAGDAPDPVSVLRRALQVFISQKLLNLKTFRFSVRGEGHHFLEKLKEEFEELDWISRKINEYDKEELSAIVKLPVYFPESTCKIVAQYYSNEYPYRAIVWYDMYYEAQ